MSIESNPVDLWRNYINTTSITSLEDFRDIIYSLFPHVSQDATITVNGLTSGRSGAKVFFATFIHEGKKQNWVVKLIDQHEIKKIDSESIAITKFVNNIQPDYHVVTSPRGAIAFPYIENSRILLDFIHERPSALDIEIVINNLFELIAPWHSPIYQTWQTAPFFQTHELDNTAQKILSNNIKILWDEVKAIWSISRSCLTTICHGDLNLTNILVEPTLGLSLIDFSETNCMHWATDFVRLERQLRIQLMNEYNLLTEDYSINIAANKIGQRKNPLKRIFAYLDSSFYLDEKFINRIQLHLPEKKQGLISILQTILYLRNKIGSTFSNIVNTRQSEKQFSQLEEEYFTLLAFQQICLLASKAWEPTDGMCVIIEMSITGILNYILHAKTAREFFYGYFFIEIEGFERILVAVEENQWTFPIADFKDKKISLSEAITKSIEKLFYNLNVKNNFINAGFNYPQIHYLNLYLYPDYPSINIGDRKQYIIPIFVKIPLTSEFNTGSEYSARKYLWTKKIPLFKPKNIGTLSPKGITVCKHPNLLRYLTEDYITYDFGIKTLECTDIIVFSEINSLTKSQFLMLHRKDIQDKDSGWEYPKGGLEYHESINEGAIRELLEETGIETIGDFRYGGSLGFQTVDVSARLKDYDALRVHGVTYYFSGDPNDIHKYVFINKISDEHNNDKWVSIEELQRKVWMKENNYGPKFVQRWIDDRLNINLSVTRPVSLAFEITEYCPHSCKFCHRRHENEKNIDIKEIIHIISILARRQILRLTITGGEPLSLGKYTIFKIIESINQKHIHTCLSTTGVWYENGHMQSLCHEDINTLETILDHILLSVHCISSDIAQKMYKKIDNWNIIIDTTKNCLQWVKSPSLLKIEICTIVTKVNIMHIADIGEWIFQNNPDSFWRIDEYYDNGIVKITTPLNKEIYEVTDIEFAKLRSIIENKFPDQCRSNQIRFNDKNGRETAPDIMITPAGNLVRSDNNNYSIVGHSELLLGLSFGNRCAWSAYRRYCRTDWPWENYFLE